MRVANAFRCLRPILSRQFHAASATDLQPASTRPVRQEKAQSRRARFRKRRRSDLEVEEPLHFDLPRRLTKQERAEVREELSSALASLKIEAAAVAIPQRAEDIDPAELRLRTKVELLCNLRSDAGPVEVAQVLRLLIESYDTAERDAKERGATISEEFFRLAQQEESWGLAAVLRRAAVLRQCLAPEALACGIRLVLALGSQAMQLASVMLEALSQHVAELDLSELTAVLAAANKVGGLPAASQLLGSLLEQLAEQSPVDLKEEDLYGTLEVLGGHVGEVDPATLEDFIESLRFFWPLCSSQTLIKALLALGQANALDVGTCRLLLQQLEARSEFLGHSDREALLLLLALHKSSFDRSTALLALPHPLYDEAAKRLIKDLSRDACGKISSAPMESLSRPVLALAELKVLDRRALHALTERLVSGRLLSLSPSAFVSLVYAHRLVRGPVPLEKLRMPLCLAFGALLHAMTPKQVASCIESLKAYCYKAYRHVFTAAYERLARALEAQAEGLGYDPFALLTPAEVAVAIRSFPELKFEECHLLLRMLNALGSPQLLTSQGSGGTQLVPQEAVQSSLLGRMTMAELVDVFEAFGAQGLASCDSVAQAIVHRYGANGGRISRRNAARVIRVMAQLRLARPELLELLLAELNGWQESDPNGSELRPRPALTVLWSLSALELLPRTAHLVDWFLESLCREAVAGYVLGTKGQAVELFESLGAAQSSLPQLTTRHLETLMAEHSPAAEQVLLEIGQGRELRPAQELLGMPRSKVMEHQLLEPQEAQESSLNSEDLGFEGSPDLQGRSLLDELALRWELHRSQEGRAIPKSKQLMGLVLAGLNAAPLLRATPHPLGTMAQEELRGSGGFEQQWPVGCYDVDWGHPFFRIGILVLRDQDFLYDATATAHGTELHGAARLRLRLLSEERWWLILLRASAVDTWIVPKDPQLFNRQLQARVARANKLYHLERRPLQRKMRDLDNEAENLRQLFMKQLQQQLDFIFPDALVGVDCSFGLAKSQSPWLGPPL